MLGLGGWVVVLMRDFMRVFVGLLNVCFFFNDTATTEIYTLSLQRRSSDLKQRVGRRSSTSWQKRAAALPLRLASLDRKSTRLNSSHTVISYAVFCLKKK